jgi:hypothetical protein
LFAAVGFIFLTQKKKGRSLCEEDERLGLERVLGRYQEGTISVSKGYRIGITRVHKVHRGKFRSMRSYEPTAGKWSLSTSTSVQGGLLHQYRASAQVV